MNKFFQIKIKIFYINKFSFDLRLAEAIATFLPKDTTPARAWTLAKVSLRSLKRDLRRKQGNFKVI